MSTQLILLLITLYIYHIYHIYDLANISWSTYDNNSRFYINWNNKLFYLLRRFYGFCWRSDHKDAIREDGTDDKEVKKGVDEDVDGCTSKWAEGAEQPHGLSRWKSEDVFAFTDNREHLSRQKQRKT